MRRQEGGSAGEHDFGPELFGIGGGSEQARYGAAGDEQFYDQSNTLRRGFGHPEPPRGRLESEQAEFGSAYPSAGRDRYSTSGPMREWRDVARDRQGPRGYTRSDERIHEFICERLAQLHHLDVSDVSVTVSNGIVTLEGTVPDRGMKHRIEDTADSCWGVQNVENRIRVRRPDAQADAEGTSTPLAHESRGASGTRQEAWESDLGPGRASEVDPRAIPTQPATRRNE
ncbi:MAG TPA: BON domain-containing protein [Aromatoleum sp.]|uniref:BON domain-containing protein n=1 Tax=Aromatoleum sp. TaxID=2307007 RepID=UPI002B4A2F44|nr:BON domain-containing protein [Aromatoleum sp.]HJV24637.1 BON domain-containing protein [Aromatoleum sp.]